MRYLKARKRKKRLKIFLILFLIILAIIATAVFALWHFGGRPSLHSVDASQMRTMDFLDIDMYPQSFATDALHLIRLAEESHPIFVLGGWLPKDYEAIRDEFLIYARNEDITKLDFAFAAMRYITTLRDSHTSLNGMNMPTESGSWKPIISGGRLDIDWQEQNGKLFLTDDDITEVIEIGGVSVEQIFVVIDRYFYPENEFCRRQNHSNLSRLGDIIERAGGYMTNDSVQITLVDNQGEVVTKDVPWVSEDAGSSREFIIRHEMIDDIFFIDLRVFIYGEHITETVQAIEVAIENGTREFVIDLRGNSGGSSWAGERLLGAMGITIPQHGMLVRTSQLAIEQGGMWHLGILNWFGVDYIIMPPTIDTASNPDDILVSVLTDASSYSSAMWMASWVQDGGFGNVIGSPSRNAPTSFGNVLQYTLPYSGIEGAISYVQWLRPDENANPLVLMPDILVHPKDALDVALEYLHNMNR